MRKFTELVAGFQACAKRVKITVRLWQMDCMVCCDSGLPEDQLFDAIDTSNLADNVELLNLLLMAGPRLKKTPFSRCPSCQAVCRLLPLPVHYTWMQIVRRTVCDHPELLSFQSRPRGVFWSSVQLPKFLRVKIKS